MWKLGFRCCWVGCDPVASYQLAVMEKLMKYRVKIEKTEEGYAIWCPALPGCWSQGTTEEEALENIKDAIATYLTTVEELLEDRVTRLVEVAV